MCELCWVVFPRLLQDLSLSGENSYFFLVERAGVIGEKLVKSNLRLVVKVATKYRPALRLNRGLDFLDLLKEAVAHFRSVDPDALALLERSLWAFLGGQVFLNADPPQRSPANAEYLEVYPCQSQSSWGKERIL